MSYDKVLLKGQVKESSFGNKKVVLNKKDQETLWALKIYRKPNKYVYKYTIQILKRKHNFPDTCKINLKYEQYLKLRTQTGAYNYRSSWLFLLDSKTNKKLFTDNFISF